MGRDLTNLYISQSFEFLTQISGSELQTGLGQTLTGSLLITASRADIATTATTASYVQNAASASYALTASFALNAGGGGTVNTGSLMVTGSVNSNTLTFTKGDGSTFNLTVNTGSGGGTINTGSLLVTASVSNDTITYTKGDGSTFTNTVNNVVSANTASYVLNAISASYATFAATATSASFATNAASATTASYVLNAVSSSYATFAATATSASFATNASTAATATSASFATIAATATSLPNGINISASNITVADNLVVNGTASISFLETVSGSAVYIGQEFIILNTTPTSRYSGIVTVESGSSPATTASFQFDSQTNDWFYEYTGSDPTNFGVAMFGPEYATKGSPTYLTNNRIPKGNGGHHLNDSSITDNGTTVSTTLPLSGTQITASNGFLGNLTGTASIATLALTASKVISDGQLAGGNQFLLISNTNAAGGTPLAVRTSNLVYNSTTNTLPTTASYATNATNATSASFATNAANASSASFATNAATATSASFATNASTAASASFATNAANASSASFATTSSFAVTASYASNAVGAITGGEIYSYTFLLMGS